MTWTLLPHAVLMTTGCLFLVASRLTARKAVWGPLCLVSLLVAAFALGISSHDLADIDSNGNQKHQDLSSDADTEASSDLRVSQEVLQTRMAISFQWALLGWAVLMTLIGQGRLSQLPAAAEHCGLFLLAISGAMLVAVANDLILMFLGLEICSLCVSLLLLINARSVKQVTQGHRVSVLRSRAAGSYYFLGTVLSACMLYGFCFVYGITGTTNLTDLQHVLVNSYRPENSELPIGRGSVLGLVAMVLILAGSGFRMGIVPFHFGSAEVCDESPTWIVGLMTVLPRAVGILVLVRVAQALAGFEADGQLLTLVLSVVTMTFGSLMALKATKLHQLLAFMGIAQMGFALLGFAAGFEVNGLSHSVSSAWSLLDGNASGWLHFVFASLAITGLVAILTYLSPDAPIVYSEELKGLLYREPLSAIAAIMFLLTLAGLPPSPGFWSRWSVFASVLSAKLVSSGWDDPSGGAFGFPHPAFVAAGIVAVLHLLMTAGLVLRLIILMGIDRPLGRFQPAGGQLALAVALILMLLFFGIGLLPGPVLGFFGENL